MHLDFKLTYQNLIIWILRKFKKNYYSSKFIKLKPFYLNLFNATNMLFNQ